jgi:hypothetical protein
MYCFITAGGWAKEAAPESRKIVKARLRFFIWFFLFQKKELHFQTFKIETIYD